MKTKSPKNKVMCLGQYTCNNLYDCPHLKPHTKGQFKMDPSVNSAFRECMPCSPTEWKGKCACYSYKEACSRLTLLRLTGHIPIWRRDEWI